MTKTNTQNKHKNTYNTMTQQTFEKTICVFLCKTNSVHTGSRITETGVTAVSTNVVDVVNVGNGVTHLK